MTVPAEHDAAERLKGAISGRLGLSFEHALCGQLATVVNERLRATRCRDMLGYFQLVVAPRSPEMRVLAERLTVSETYFFRHAEQFRALVREALPARLRANSGSRALRILSAGCASGEEPYTLAMVLRDTMPDLDSWEVMIEAVDVNASLLAKAKRAHFPEWSLRQTPEDVRRRYFRRAGRELVLDDRIRSAVMFEERNLVEEDPGFWERAAFDVIFCRNVIMYFTPEATRRFIDRLRRSLAPGGFLFLAPAETLRGISGDFQLHQSDGAFYYELPEPAREPIAKAVVRAPPIAIPPVTVADVPAAAAAAAVEPRGASWSRRAWDLGYATELLREARFRTAIEVLRSLPPQGEGDPEVQLLLAVLLAQNGEMAEAERVCRMVLSLDQGNVEAHYLSALVRAQAGDCEAARAQDEMATTLDPTFALPHLHLGLLAMARGHFDVARTEFAAALALLGREDESRIVLFGGGFNREALIRLCRAELLASGGAP